jgi:SAM-dependent methyltransferase
MDDTGVSTTTTTTTNPTAKASTVACPVCGSGDVTVAGRPYYRQPTTVAGVPIDVSDLDLKWRRCGACGYHFIHPGIPDDRLLNCYRSASTGHWGTGESYPELRFYDQKKQLLDRFSPGKRVLDFGCFDGGFLEYLGPAYEKFGIEPSADAARSAGARGVKILGATTTEAQQSADAQAVGPVDAIVAFDVFEHLVDPVGVLRDLRRLLRPGGIMVIETGDSDAPLWKRVGIRYGYAAYVEHVGLFNRTSIAAAGKHAGLSLVHYQTSKHHVIPWRYVPLFHLYNVAYGVLRAMDKLRLPLPKKLRAAARGPLPRTTEADHFLAVLRAD